MSKPSNASLVPWLGAALILILLDQFTKILIVGYYQLGEGQAVTSFFNVVRAHNTGAAFSFLAGAAGWQRWLFTAIGVGAAGLSIWMLRAHAGQRLFSFALACILGGAIGNVLDRVRLGYVVERRPCQPRQRQDFRRRRAPLRDARRRAGE